VSRPAVFLDRDGTLIRDVNYVGKPEQVELLPGAARALRRLNEAGWPVIIVTNQSGIARGFYTVADYEAVQREVESQLAAHGARIDAAYMCPHLPDITGPCECRKPGTLLFRQAAEAHDLDLARSWYVGDRMRDVLPAQALGGRGLLVPGPETPSEDLQPGQFATVASLDEAATRIMESAR
jgi:D-glycero-D-manno-heptose 1,7-bisphosphate phosphatase